MTNMLQNIQTLRATRATNNATTSIKTIDIYDVKFDIDVQRNITRFHNVEYNVAIDITQFIDNDAQHVLFTTCNVTRTLSNVTLYKIVNDKYVVVFRSKTSSLMNMYEFMQTNNMFTTNDTYNDIDKICRTISNARATQLKKFIDDETNNTTK